MKGARSAVQAEQPAERASDASFAAPLAEIDLLCERLHSERRASVGGLWGSSQALLLAELDRRGQGPWLVTVSTDAEAEAFAEDLAQFGSEPFLCPALGGPKGADAEAMRARLELAQRLAGPQEARPRLIVGSALALLETVPEAGELGLHFLALEVGKPLRVEPLLARLVQAGFARQPLVERPGEISLRGDILDLWPFASELPLRVELFDDEVESLRRFDPEEQRSVEALQKVEVCLVTNAGGVDAADGARIFRRVSPATIFVDVEPLRIAERTEDLRIQSALHSRALLELSAARGEHRQLELQSLPGRDLTFDTRTTQSLGGDLEGLAARVLALGPDHEVVILARSEGERRRLAELLGEASARVTFREGSIAKGFRFPALARTWVNYRELAGISGAALRHKKRANYRTRALQSFFELRPGDFVVHAVHGLARFKGLVRVERGGGEEEHLHLEFADEVSLYVPGARIDLVQRYIGAGNSAAAGPPLDKIGGSSFRKRKEKVERALYDLAASLLEVQAQRELKQRAAWRFDEELLGSLHAQFPHVPTDDQLAAEREIDADLRSTRPMDRLLCGDVGFGKTEVAMRAAFRVVTAGAQVAVLAPTTVLANQHEKTFRERFAGLPVRVESISRYATGKAAKEILEAARLGQVDVLVGTHRLLSKDVGFQNLGLVVIDEEQRFGVTHKEHFKRFRAEIDVLTLSATPIPRTLHMSLAGLRDISALSEPPPGRQEIETKLIFDADRDTIRAALLYEHNRGGQVFFLYNRVATIAQRARELAELAPECSFAVGHGQMSSAELRAVMDGFARGAFDVLVASTIIENGLDIPAAGTIFIDQADHFGLSEMHQLRGRVGRGSQKAYCYLLVSPNKPLSSVSRERLKALEELSHLGAGFAISMKDLEIRGAGNVLGPQQSGHIGAVGYDMYCRLLKQTVERVRAGLEPGEELAGGDESAGVELELGLRAFLPESWIPAQETRIEILRELEVLSFDADIARAEEALRSLRDRFGRVPEEALELVRQFHLRGRLQPLGIRRLAWRGDAYLLEYSDRVALQALLEKKKVELRPVREGIALLVVPLAEREPARALRWFERLLGEPPWPASARR